MSRPAAYQALLSTIRRTGLLSLADKVRYMWVRRSSSAARKAFARRHPDFALPPEDIAYDAFGVLDWQVIRDGGAETAAHLGKILRDAFPDRQPRRVLEWGCGPARIIRYMPAVLNASGCWSVFGSDYNPATIRWCRETFADIDFSENTLEPPLPYEAASFDAVYCISVFTHLSEEAQPAWASELARVLKPGGLLIASFHGTATRSFLVESEQRRFDSGALVVRAQVPEGTRAFTAYHPPAFVRALLAPYFEIVGCETRPVASLGLQELCVARRSQT